ncbi:MAG: glutamine--fructose-6-phosphate transaminase (isomerizing), partial [Gemmatimonadetes bacterium]|nr:glutamine--fructose-6-phosphate transaminase (isomerizing) [Gemmatimonadota bacterium]
SRDAQEILLSGLGRLEYRGYDSIGLAVQGPDGLQVRKVVGRLPQLNELLQRRPVAGPCGIGHTRWATHGGVTDVNAHPHVDCHGEIALVHNGIIENADLLRAQLERDGHHFTTETDSEVLAHLIEAAAGPTLEARIRTALAEVTGTYGLAVVSAAEPGKVIAVRRGSPVLLGLGEDEVFVASDATALAGYAQSVVYLNDGDLAVLDGNGYRVLDDAEVPQERVIDELTWDPEAAALGGHPTFMWKEILEQPETVANVMRGRLVADTGSARLDGLGLTPEQCRRLERIRIVGCGTSWHAGLVGRHIIEELAGIPVEVDYASEFRYRHSTINPQMLTVAISQSGETADTLEAVRAVHESGGRVVGLVNVVGSTIARETDGGVYLHAGPEIGVASTKAFTAQLVALLLFALHLGRHRGLPTSTGRALISELNRLPELVARALGVAPAVERIAQDIVDARNAIYLGRGIQHPVALEGALKLKEISYVHAEGYPAAEMKHGPLALVDADLPVVALAPFDRTYTKVLSNIREVKASGGRVIVVTT